MTQNPAPAPNPKAKRLLGFLIPACLGIGIAMFWSFYSDAKGAADKQAKHSLLQKECMQLVAAQVANPQSIKTGVGDSEVYKNAWGGDITLVRDFRADNANNESERYQVECTLADGQVKLDSLKKQ